jgi:hypothetical protein
VASRWKLRLKSAIWKLLFSIARGSIICGNFLLRQYRRSTGDRCGEARFCGQARPGSEERREINRRIAVGTNYCGRDTAINPSADEHIFTAELQSGVAASDSTNGSVQDCPSDCIIHYTFFGHSPTFTIG